MQRFSTWFLVVLLTLISVSTFAQTPLSFSAGGLFTRTGAPAAVSTPFPADAGFFTLTQSEFTALATHSVDIARIENFPLGSQSVTLSVEQFEVLAANAKILVSNKSGKHPFSAPMHVLLHGQVEEIPGSHVYLAVFGDHTIGYIQTPEYRYLIQPISLSSEAASTMISYKENDIDRPNSAKRSFTCGTETLGSNQAQIQKIEAELLASPMEASKIDPLAKTIKILKIDVECDYEYFLDHKSDTAKALAYVIADVGAVSDVYVRDLSSAVQAQYINIWTEDDPFTEGPSTSELLEALDQYGPSELPDDDRASCILMSGINHIGGLAHLGVICPPTQSDFEFGYCVCATDNTYTFPQDGFVWDVNVVAHEFGHNIGSLHTHSCSWNPAIDSCYESESGNCFSTIVPVKGTIMSYCHLTNKGSELKFHARNIPKLKQWISQASCVTSQPLPIALAGKDTYRCGSDSATLFASVLDGTAPYKYSWRLHPQRTAFASTAKITVKPNAATAKYIVTVTDANGLRTYDTALVTANTLKANAGADVSTCGVSSISLTGSASNGVGDYTYQWIDSASGAWIGNGANFIAPLTGASKTFALKVIDSVGCTSTDYVHINITLPPVASVTPQGTATVCEGDSLQLDAGAGFSKYKWSNGDTTRKIWVKSAGNYSVAIANGACADTSDAVAVTINPAPPKPNVVKNGSELIASEGLAYQWYRNNKEIPDATAKEQNYVPKADGTFYVVVTGSNGCSSKSDPVVITLGVEEQLQTALRIYPNPASDVLTIEWMNTTMPAASAYITDLQGKIVLNVPSIKASTYTIDIRSLQSGSYFLHYNNGSEVIEKFVKQ